MKLILFVSLLIMFAGVSVSSQTNSPLTDTWKAGDISGIWQLLGEDAPRNTPTRSQVLKFTPAGDSGVVASLADAFGGDAVQRSTIADALTQIKQGYEAEVAKEGKSNNVAAAMTFFVVANVVTYHQLEMPSEADTDKVFDSLQNAMVRLPAVAAMSNAEKHRLHDWLVCMGGFALSNYVTAKQQRDAGGLETIKRFAGYSMQLALGIEAQKVSLAGQRLVVQTPAARNPRGETDRIVGAWTYASVAANAGHMRLRYIFNADGTYNFKSERNYTSQRWWTIEESGSYAINENSLTISPKTSRATLRNLNGVVQETKANPLETVTYKWTTHFFEGIGETNLVLEPPQPTSRDGVLGSNSLFPRAYLYSQGDRLEWRF